MKKLSLVLCLVMIFCSLLTFVACNGDDTPTDSLVVYNWADYIFYDYEEAFQEYYKSITGKNIEITYVTFDTNETMLTKLTKGDSNVDVVCPSEYAIQKLMEMQWLIPLNYFEEDVYKTGMTQSESYVHFADNIDKNITAKIDETFGEIQVGDKKESMLDYMVPYMYGTLGILYNKQEFYKMFQTDDPAVLSQVMNDANWGILFNDDGKGNLFNEQLTGQILMKDSIRDTYAATIFYLMESGKLEGFTDPSGKLYTEMSANQLINCVDDQLLDLVKETLTNQKSQLFGYEVDFGKDDLLKGNAMADLAWSGDALYAVEESWNDYLCAECHNSTGVAKKDEIICSVCGEECGDYELSYYVPHTTGNIWFDGWVIPKNYNPEHTEAIKLFINFLNSPYSAASNMMEIGYSSAVAPSKLLEDDEAKAVLAEVYCVNAPEYLSTETLATIKKENDGFDYDTWADFEEEFFRYEDEIDGTNWRYPLESNFDGVLRSASDYGVMRDFGDKNKQVVTTWNYVRSAGVNALPLFLWVTLAVVVLVGGAYLAHFFVVRSRMKVKVSK